VDLVAVVVVLDKLLVLRVLLVRAMLAALE
jgi:hypothetical protein